MNEFNSAHAGSDAPRRSRRQTPNPAGNLLFDPSIPGSKACLMLGGIVSHTARRMELRGLLTPHKVSGRKISYRLSEIHRLMDSSKASAQSQPAPTGAVQQ